MNSDPERDAQDSLGVRFPVVNGCWNVFKDSPYSRLVPGLCSRTELSQFS